MESKNLDFKNSITKQGISVEKRNVNVRLFLCDDQYQALAERTTLLEECGLSFDELLKKTDAILNAYVDFPTHGKATLTLFLESEELGYKDYKVKLTKHEQTTLKHELTEIIKQIKKEKLYMQKTKKIESGTIIRLIKMEGEPQMSEGLIGRVKYTDDIGQIHTSWNNGSSLAIVPEVDEFEVIGKIDLDRDVFWVANGVDGVVNEMYINTDASSGFQIVANIFFFEDILAAYNKLEKYDDSFWGELEGEAIQYLYDVDTELFPYALEEFNKDADFYGATEETLKKIVKTIKEKKGI